MNSPNGSRAVLCTFFLFSSFLTIGCESRSSSEFCSISDVHYDGQTVSVIIGRKRSLRGKDFVSHSSGWSISDREDSWLVTWPITINRSGDDAPSVSYLGAFEEQRSDKGKNIASQTGYRSIRLRGIGDETHVVVHGKQLQVMSCQTGKVSPSIGDNHDAIAPNQYIFTRNRDHVFGWLPVPSVYSLPDMEVVDELEVTEALERFKELYWWRENRTVLLTDDLEYLVAVPHNGASDRTQGGAHTKAFCYQLKSDKVTTVQLEGLGDAMIHDAQPTEDGMHWLVHRGHSDEWLILDSASKKIAEMKIPSPPDRHWQRLFWEPDWNRIRIVRYPAFLGHLETNAHTVAIVTFNIDDGSHTEAELTVGPMKVP